jgi:hypothetical protein
LDIRLLQAKNIRDLFEKGIVNLVPMARVATMKVNSKPYMSMRMGSCPALPSAYRPIMAMHS